MIDIIKTLVLELVELSNFKYIVNSSLNYRGVNV